MHNRTAARLACVLLLSSASPAGAASGRAAPPSPWSDATVEGTYRALPAPKWGNPESTGQAFFPPGEIVVGKVLSGKVPTRNAADGAAVITVMSFQIPGPAPVLPKDGDRGTFTIKVNGTLVAFAPAGGAAGDGKKQFAGPKAPRPVNLDRKVSAQFENTPLADLLEMLLGIDGMRYLAPADVLKNAKPVTLDTEGEQTLRSALDEACKQAGVEWSLTPDGVVAIKAKGAKEPPAGEDVPTVPPPAGLSEKTTVWFGYVAGAGIDFERDKPRMRRQILVDAYLKSGEAKGPFEALTIRHPAHWRVDPIHASGVRLSTNDPATKRPPEGTDYAQIDVAVYDKESPEEAKKEIDRLATQPGAEKKRGLDLEGASGFQVRMKEEIASPGSPGDPPTPARFQARVITVIAEGKTVWHLDGCLPVAADPESTESKRLLAEMEAIGANVKTWKNDLGAGEPPKGNPAPGKPEREILNPKPGPLPADKEKPAARPAEPEGQDEIVTRARQFMKRIEAQKAAGRRAEVNRMQRELQMLKKQMTIRQLEALEKEPSGASDR